MEKGTSRRGLKITLCLSIGQGGLYWWMRDEGGAHTLRLWQLIILMKTAVLILRIQRTLRKSSPTVGVWWNIYLELLWYIGKYQADDEDNNFGTEIGFDAWRDSTSILIRQGRWIFILFILPTHTGIIYIYLSLGLQKYFTYTGNELNKKQKRWNSSPLTSIQYLSSESSESSQEQVQR